MTKISNCGHDERYQYSGGNAGDQGGEWILRDWYKYPWNVVLRHPDKKVQSMIAQMATAAADNNNIGYDQSERLTFWEYLKRANYKPENIVNRCEADCSSGVAAIVKGAGYRLGIKKLQDVSVYLWTGNMRAALIAAGFSAYSSAKYTDLDSYLLPGDILLNEAHHVCTNVTSGALAGGSTEIPKAPGTSAGSIALIIDGEWGKATTRALQRQLGTPVDGIISGQLKSCKKYMIADAGSWQFDNGDGSMCIAALQRKLGVAADGYFGKNTSKALQRKLGVAVDGITGKDTTRALQKALNANKVKGW